MDFWFYPRRPLGRVKFVFYPYHTACLSGFSLSFSRVHSLGLRPPLLVVAISPLALFAQDRLSGTTPCRSTPHRQFSRLGGLLVLPTASIGTWQVRLLMTLSGASKDNSTRNPTQDRSCGSHCMSASHVSARFLSSPRRPLGRVKPSVRSAPLSRDQPPLLIVGRDSRNSGLGTCQVFLLMTLPGASRYNLTRNPTQDRSCGSHCVSASHVSARFLSSPRHPLGRVKSSVRSTP